MLDVIFSSIEGRTCSSLGKILAQQIYNVDQMQLNEL